MVSVVRWMEEPLELQTLANRLASSTATTPYNNKCMRPIGGGSWLQYGYYLS